jgi:hypothetical protein
MKEFVRSVEREVNEARQRGDIPSLIEMASAAMDELEAAAGTAGGTLDENQFLALSAAKRVGYNVAADIWPGWEVPAPQRSDSELQSAQALAQRSSSLVDKLKQGPTQRGNAIWLIGALHLARRSYEEARDAFAAAASFYADGSAMKILSEGYMAIVMELLSTSPVKGTTEFDLAIARLRELPSEDAKVFREQLLIARQVFVPRKVEGGLTDAGEEQPHREKHG